MTNNEMISNETFDFGDGLGPVPAHRHPNGGGWVADSATVAESAYVSSKARVYGHAVVGPDATISGHVAISGNTTIGDHTFIGGRPGTWICGRERDD